ncbi:MAG: hypothetical protein ABI723_16885 [Bacteroidia bacterium]
MSTENKQSLTTETIFPLIVGGLSLLNLFSHLSDPLRLSNLLSLVGLGGTFFYFKKNDIFKKLIYIWILAQVIVIEPIFDMTQVVNFKLGFSFSTSTSEYGIKVNIVAILFFGLLKILEVSSLVGKQITFNQFRQDNQLGDIFPLEGTILKRVTLSQEKDWLLVQLTTPFEYDGKPVSHALVKRKDGETIKLKTKNQIAYFRLVYNFNEIIAENNDSSKFPFVDWVLCE